MAKFTLTDVAVIVNGVTLSNRARAVTVTDNRAQVDLTAFGASNIEYGKGLGDGSFQVEFFQDFAAGSVHATLQPLISSDTPVEVEIRPTSAARSATNPGIVLEEALMFDYSPLAGTIGDGSTFSTVFQNAGQNGVTYPTS